jgi:hypothetical protein
MDIVTSVDENHFRESDGPLLVQYVQAIELAEHAAKQMEAEGGPVVDGKVSLWLTVQTRAVKTMTILATRLRLSPQSRREGTKRAGNNRATLSYYERQALEQGGDDAG